MTEREGAERLPGSSAHQQPQHNRSATGSESRDKPRALEKCGRGDLEGPWVRGKEEGIGQQFVFVAVFT